MALMLPFCFKGFLLVTAVALKLAPGLHAGCHAAKGLGICAIWVHADYGFWLKYCGILFKENTESPKLALTL